MENIVPLRSTGAERLPIRERAVRAMVDVRRDCGLTAAAFASAVNAALGYGAVTADQVGAWERGVAVPPLDIFLAMLTVAGPAAGRVWPALVGN